jgi:hypothetical protein
VCVYTNADYSLKSMFVHKIYTHISVRWPSIRPYVECLVSCLGGEAMPTCADSTWFVRLHSVADLVRLLKCYMCCCHLFLFGTLLDRLL